MNNPFHIFPLLEVYHHFSGSWKRILLFESLKDLVELLTVVFVILESLVQVQIVHIGIDYASCDIRTVVAYPLHAGKKVV